MYRTIDDFRHSHANLTQGTGRLFDVLTDDNMHQRVADGHRTLRDIAWHIVVTVPEMMRRTGLKMSSVDPESMPPDSAQAIRDGYHRVSAELANALRSTWTDATLLETDDMYGERWMRGQTLSALHVHEIHHRGEMVVLLRQAGATVPGLYGPAKEEWTQYGMKPPAY